jgi:ABC-type branched-subunit amino acid transport system substrate-binding protein/serine/threonine protein kinase
VKGIPSPNRPSDPNATQFFEAISAKGERALLKVVSDRQGQQVALLRQESTLLATVQHPALPKWLGLETLQLAKGSSLHCLLREYIEGEDLAQWLTHHPPLTPPQAQEWFICIVDCLAVVHQAGFKHLDLKPANLILTPEQTLRIFDFSDRPGTLSVGYSPPEQAEGKPAPQSDWFALARTFIHLMTGQHPLDLPTYSDTGKLRWQERVPKLPTAFATLLDRMMAPQIQDRPQSSAEILAALQSAPPSQINRWNLKPLLWGGALLALGLMGGLGLNRTPLFQSQTVTQEPDTSIDHQQASPIATVPTCDREIDDTFSCGEESLWSDPPPPPLKREAMTAYAQQDYATAVTKFQEALNLDSDDPDPETQIYLNNAIIARDQLPHKTITFAGPMQIRDVVDLRPALRAIAAHQQVSMRRDDQLLRGHRIQILLADDGNKPEDAKRVVEGLGARADVVGVVGHYSSAVTQKVLAQYEKAKLVLVSYGSTSRDLSCTSESQCPKHIFYRTAPSTNITAQQLATYLVVKQKHQRVAILYNNEDSFSRSLADDFALAIDLSGGVVELNPDLCNQIGKENLEQNLKPMSAIALFPDGQSCARARDQVLAMVEKTKTVVGSWTLDNENTLERVQQQNLSQVVLSIPWHPLQSDAEEFFKTYPKYGLTQEQGARGLLNSLTATTFDAMAILIKALGEDLKDGSVTRASLHQQLSKVETIGMTGTVRFQGTDRRRAPAQPGPDLRKAIATLVQAVPTQNCGRNWAFVPLDSPAAVAGKLVCPEKR